MIYLFIYLCHRWLCFTDCTIQYLYHSILRPCTNKLFKSSLQMRKRIWQFLECLWSVVLNEAGNFKHNSSVVNTVSLIDSNMIVCFPFPKSTLEVVSDFSRHLLASVGFNMWTLQGHWRLKKLPNLI